MVIEPKAEEESKSKGKSKKVYKTRSFEAYPLMYLAANEAWDGGGSAKGNVVRPVFMMFGQTEQASRAFVANMRGGKQAQLITRNNNYSNVDKNIEILKSQGYRWVSQRVTGAAGANGEPLVVTTVYKPELFQLEPPLIDPQKAAFVAVPPRWWLEQEEAKLREDVAATERLLEYCRASRFQELLKLSDDDLLELVPLAAYWFAFMSNRTKVALPIALEFQLHVFLAALTKGVAVFANTGRPEKYSWARTAHYSGFTEEIFHPIKLTNALLTNVEQNELSRFLEEQCRLYKANNDKLDALYPQRKEEALQRRREQYEQFQSLRKSIADIECRYDEAPKITVVEERAEIENLDARRKHRSSGNGTSKEKVYSLDDLYQAGVSVEPVWDDEIPEEPEDEVPDKEYDNEVAEEAAAQEDDAETEAAIWDELPQEDQGFAEDLWNKVNADVKEFNGLVELYPKEAEINFPVLDLDDMFPFGLKQEVMDLSAFFETVEVIDDSKPKKSKKKGKVAA